VATLQAGTGVTVTNGSGEGVSPTVAIGQAVGTTDSPQFNNLTATGTVSANAVSVTNGVGAGSATITGTTATSVLTVDGIEIDTTGATSNDFLKYNGAKFVPSVVPASILSGTILAPNVTTASLTSLSTLTSLTVSGNVTVDTNTFFVNSGTNRVGIINTSPSYALDVNGDINAASALRIGGNTVGTFTSYTPTITPFSGSFTTLGAVYGKYTRVGKYVHVFFDFTITTNGTAGTFINVTKPITSVATLGSGTGALGVATEIAVAGYFGVVRDAGTTAVLITGTPGSPTYMGANGARIAGHFSYEAA
jgi:hypothetical protein